MNLGASPIRHLYFFDDLSFHIKRISKSKGVGLEPTQALLRSVWDLLLDAFKCVDHRVVDMNLCNWEHASIQLAFQLKTARRQYDIMVSQGCNGEYALDDLNAVHEAQYGYKVAERTPNVRLAHLLHDPTDPFYSTFELGVSSGEPLDAQIARVAELARKLYRERRTNLRLAVFDDCMGTGEGSKHVATKLIEMLGPDVPHSMHMVAFIGNESAMYRFQEVGFETHIGVLFRGKVYPEAWDWDIYFLKDQFLNNAIRYSNGTSEPYLAGGWYDKIFAADPRTATNLFLQIKELLEQSGHLKELEAM